MRANVLGPITVALVVLATMAPAAFIDSNLAVSPLGSNKATFEPTSTAGASTTHRLAPVAVSMASRRDPSLPSNWAIATRPDGSTVQVRV